MTEVYRSLKHSKRIQARTLKEEDLLSQPLSIDAGKNGIFQTLMMRYEAEQRARERNFLVKRLDFRRRVNRQRQVFNSA